MGLMAEWVEIPAQRVLLVDESEMREFEPLDENGQPAPKGAIITMVRRRRDAKLFQVSPWQPQPRWGWRPDGPDRWCTPGGRIISMIALSEVGNR